jgi:hypothetical protein
MGSKGVELQGGCGKYPMKAQSSNQWLASFKAVYSCLATGRLSSHEPMRALRGQRCGKAIKSYEVSPIIGVTLVAIKMFFNYVSVGRSKRR